jgi:hypothetical protein
MNKGPVFFLFASWRMASSSCANRCGLETGNSYTFIERSQICQKAIQNSILLVFHGKSSSPMEKVLKNSPPATTVLMPTYPERGKILPGCQSRSAGPQARLSTPEMRHKIDSRTAEMPLACHQKLPRCHALFEVTCHRLVTWENISGPDRRSLQGNKGCGMVFAEKRCDCFGLHPAYTSLYTVSPCSTAFLICPKSTGRGSLRRPDNTAG